MKSVRDSQERLSNRPHQFFSRRFAWADYCVRSREKGESISGKHSHPCFFILQNRLIPRGSLSTSTEA